MARTAVLGFPRIGPDRELKRALEGHWAESTSAAQLQDTARELRAERLEAGLNEQIDVLPVGDFALYDHVLDVAELFTIIAPRHSGAEASGTGDHFRACRGAEGVAPLEMTKWFDTNYHYLVPELQPGQDFAVRPESLAKWTSHLRAAQEQGVANPRPVLLGPISLLALSKGVDQPLAFAERLTGAYIEVLTALCAAGAREVQLDEPVLVLDQTPAAVEAFTASYLRILDASSIKVTLATYFDAIDAAVLERIGELSFGELHVDLTRAPQQLQAVLAALPESTRLSAGVVDGRNIWVTDVDRALSLLDTAAAQIGSDRLTIATSCSLLHVPYNAARETGLDAELRSWLAFGDEKMVELTLLKQAFEAPAGARDALLAKARARVTSRKESLRTNDPAVRARTGVLSPADYDRDTSIFDRLVIQGEELALPELPTTTIGSFPQTAEIREARRRRRSGELSDEAYTEFIQGQIAGVVDEQERLGLDVLVHGEPERNDMVEYFGEQLNGFAFSRLGWVQSYGSRAVKPPILYGDVSRPQPMTVAWWQYAQSLTERPMKGMLTGPVTILQWSFVRDDQPRAETCLQIALAIQDEVADLQTGGAQIIQIDEAALREGLPLKHSDQPGYMRWAIDCFRLSAAAATAATQIHTHMCYSEFGEILDDIARLDADVISIEASRSDMELLAAFQDVAYPGQIGPGIYDIHSPRVPSVDELESLLATAEARIPRTQLWVNPDCGLKTRGWPETREALTNLVETARRRRAVVAA
jgi:5-methyltetrahydropteroyltriglutamate--homocysteine methyltransferase